MEYVAMEWDHESHKETIKWLVMSCSGTGMHAGAIQAFKPRCDIAYFVDETCAVEVSRIFAKIKNGETPTDKIPVTPGTEFVAYEWDHIAGSDIFKWAVLRWDKNNIGDRIDVAYFLDADTAENDAKALSDYLNTMSIAA